MFKITLFTIVVLCYVGCSVADLSTTESTREKELSFLQRVRKRISSAYNSMKKWFSKFFDDAVHPVKAIGGLVLRLELVAISLNEHLAFPTPPPAEEERERAIAKTVAALWQKLDTMEKIDEILMNVTEDIARISVFEYENITEILFEKIKSKLSEDPALFAKFNHVKAKFELELVNATGGGLNFSQKMDSDDEKAFQEFINEFSVKKLIVNKRFLLNAKKWRDVKKNKKTRANFVFARSILKLARKPEIRDKLQSIYDEVIVNTAKFIEPLDDVAGGVILLFAELRIQIDKDPLLKSEIELVSKEIISKIDEDAHWDDDNFDKYMLL